MQFDEASDRVSLCEISRAMGVSKLESLSWGDIKVKWAELIRLQTRLPLSNQIIIARRFSQQELFDGNVDDWAASCVLVTTEEDSSLEFSPDTPYWRLVVRDASRFQGSGEEMDEVQKKLALNYSLAVCCDTFFRSVGAEPAVPQLIIYLKAWLTRNNDIPSEQVLHLLQATFVATRKLQRGLLGLASARPFSRFKLKTCNTLILPTGLKRP